MTDIYYPDVSEFQNDENLKGALLICARATEGTHLTDPDYANYKAQAARLGAFFFAYHFLEDGETPQAQAHYAFSVVGRDTPLMLDFEPIDGAGGTFISKPTVAMAEQFIDAYRALGGTCFVLYFPRWYWQDLGSPSLSGFINRGMVLVASDYQRPTDTGPGWLPYGGLAPKVWQYTNRGPGAVATDWNVYKSAQPTVQAAVAELISLVKTGRKTSSPQLVLGKWVSDGKTSMRQLIASHPGNGVGDVLKQTVLHDAQNAWPPGFAAYLDTGNWDAPISKGVTLWLWLPSLGAAVTTASDGAGVHRAPKVAKPLLSLPKSTVQSIAAFIKQNPAVVSWLLTMGATWGAKLGFHVKDSQLLVLASVLVTLLHVYVHVSTRRNRP
jgi:hypothetical protein